METTPLYAAAPMCGVRAVWVGHISDRLSRTTEAWDSWQRPALAMTDETVALTIGFLEQIGITR
jgi:purine-nucleoside phosphorylase